MVRMLCVTAIRTVHDLSFVEVTLECTSTHAHALALLRYTCAHVAGLGYELG